MTLRYRIRAFEKQMSTYKTDKKEFQLPYMEEVLEGPIISVEDFEELNTFLNSFNTITRDLQIGLEYIDGDVQKEGEVKDE